MIYPDNFEQKIGFDAIRRRVIELCATHTGRRFAMEMSFVTEFSLLENLLRRTDEMLAVKTSEASFPQLEFDDISDSMALLRSDGGYASPTQLLAILRMLSLAVDIRKFFKLDTGSAVQTQSVRYPHLTALAGEIIPLPEVSSTINATVNRFGEIKDTASDRLYEIRRSLRAANGSVQKALRKVVEKAVSDGIIERDVNPAVRDGHMVIPVDATRRRSLGGVVLDASATGKTVYIEPYEVVEASNRIRELQIEERNEEIEILKRVAVSLRPHVDALLACEEIVGEFDFISAKAKFAKDVDARMPHIEPRRAIEWYHAVHPALLLTLRPQGREVVPLTLTLDDRQRILVISGPNAGGKSVCLKTVGVVQYMMQCGMLPTVYENSHMGLFKNIFIDIGDEQSIENDLSTYSSHLRNMRYFLHRTDRDTLLLVDEMGSGTEPQIGGALAQAILEKVASTGCLGVVTTHYQNLKTFAGETEGFVNGAMLYDRQRLEPSFQLAVGSPGSSFAIEIARKTGLDADVIAKAQEIVGSEYVNLDKYMLDIARDRRYWSNKRQTIREKEVKLDSLLERYEEKSDDLKSQRNAILHDAKVEARRILAEANARIEKTISEIRSAQADKEQTRKVRAELEAYKQDVARNVAEDAALPEALKGLKHKSRGRMAEQKARRNQGAAVQNASEPLREGDYVKMEGSNVTGRIMRISGRKAEVAFGALRSMVGLDKLARTNNIPKPATAGGASFTVSKQTSEESRQRQLNFRQELDVRGMRGDEAVQAVIYFLDDAVQFGASRLRILHGTGHGILKTLIRQQLAAYGPVKDFHDEDVRFGGAGITVVDLD